MLESLEQNNIKHLGLEGPEKPELLFDESVDVSESDWQKMFEDFIDARRRDHNDGYFGMAAGMKLLDPKRFAKLDLGQDFPDQALARLERDAEYIIAEGHWQGKDATIIDFIRLADAVKILFPDKTPPLGHFLMQKFQIEGFVRREMDKIKKDGIHLVSRLPSTLESLKIAFPEWKPPLGKADWKTVREYMIQHNEKWPRDYALVTFKILFPEEPLPQSITNEIIKQTIQKAKSNKQPLLAKELAAKKILVTDKGMEFVMEKGEKLDSDTPPIPEQINY